MRYTELPYQPDSLALFEPLAHLPYAVFFDSGYPLNNQGRYDLISANPKIIITHQNQRTLVKSKDFLRVSKDDLIELVNSYVHELPSHHLKLPFSMGALGYFSFD